MLQKNCVILEIQNSSFLVTIILCKQEDKNTWLSEFPQQIIINDTKVLLRVAENYFYNSVTVFDVGEDVLIIDCDNIEVTSH